MNNYKPPRQATKQELETFIDFIQKDELMKGFPTEPEILRKHILDNAYITVFPDYKRRDKIISVWWNTQPPYHESYLLKAGVIEPLTLPKEVAE